MREKVLNVMRNTRNFFPNRPGTTPYPSVDPTHARENFTRNTRSARNFFSNRAGTSQYPSASSAHARENFRTATNKQTGSNRTRRNNGRGAANKRQRRNNGRGAANNRTRRNNVDKACLLTKNICDSIIETYDHTNDKELLEIAEKPGNGLRNRRRNVAIECYNRIREDLVTNGVLNANHNVIKKQDIKKSIIFLFRLIHPDKVGKCEFNDVLNEKIKRANQIISSIKLHI